jgi:hypothetical protein
MWREAKSTVPGPIEPFRRWNPKAMRLWIGSLLIGLVIIGLAFRFEIPFAGVLGAVYAFALMFKLAARLMIPRRWVPDGGRFRDPHKPTPGDQTRVVGGVSR